MPKGHALSIHSPEVDLHPHFAREAGEEEEVEKGMRSEVLRSSEAWGGLSDGWNSKAIASRLQIFQQRVGN